MAVINILSPHVADLIAAGEVVERPASVIKELIENAFDAGARNITCEIRDGGCTYIRVTDDGCGMAPEDAGIAFLRHATSKLADEAGLEAIGTMGFRGEALAAISSVSRIELITRQRDAAEGTRVALTAGDIDEMGPFGCPAGTTLICRDLFYNTPARLKFLKSDRSEASACIAAALRCALGRPDVSVRFIRDGAEEFFSPGDSRMDSCAYALLGREDAAGMLPCRSSAENISVDGFVSSPSQGRGNRAHQFFYVNGRFIKSSLLQSALEQAYRNTLLTGRYPSCILYITMGLGAVDVNVHPAKTEVRFGSEKTVFDFVYHAVKMALEEENTLASPSPEASCDIHVSAPEKPYGGVSEKVPEMPSYFRAPMPDYASAQERLDLTGASRADGTVHISQKAEKAPDFAASQPAVEKNVENSVQNVESTAVPDHKILGEAFKAFIIIEHNGEILLIDKHAAHERIIFDRLKSAGSEISSQLLLTPAVLRLSPEDCELLEANGALLSELGYEIEPYGSGEYIIRGVPADMFASDASASLEEILASLRSHKDLSPASVRDEVLHTVACKAAIKAGWDTHPAELEKVAEAVLSGAVKYCPHGRPVSAVITRSDLDRLFKRIV